MGNVQCCCHDQHNTQPGRRSQVSSKITDERQITHDDSSKIVNDRQDAVDESFNSSQL